MTTPLAVTVRGMLLRELAAMTRMIELYPDDASVWREAAGVPNRGGTLVLHCCGNLRHYVGGQIGGSGYARDRDAEFTRRGVPRDELLRLIGVTADEVDRALADVRDSDLDGDFPEIVAGQRIAARELLMHVCSHLAYHLGQLDYHRRFVTGDPRGAGAMQAAELPSARPATSVSTPLSSVRRPG